MSVVAPLPPEKERKLFHEGVRLFNAGAYFQAHELWEEIWKHRQGRDQLFFQGLIQCAVALEHMRRGNATGARTLFRRCQKKLAPLPRVYRGIDIWDLMAQMARTLSPTIDPPHGSPAIGQRPTIVLSD